MAGLFTVLSVMAQHVNFIADSTLSRFEDIPPYALVLHYFYYAIRITPHAFSISLVQYNQEFIMCSSKRVCQTTNTACTNTLGRVDFLMKLTLLLVEKKTR